MLHSFQDTTHFAGEPFSRVVYVTEGALKAYIAHALTERTFAAIAGANNTSGLDSLFAFLHRNGTEEIIEAADMDKYHSETVNKGASKIWLLAKKHGMMCRRLVWNPNYKGIDDWRLALRQKKITQKEAQDMNFEQTSTQRFRVYQIDLDVGETCPFVFCNLDALHKAGYQQPPAAQYRIVYDGAVTYAIGQEQSAVLERIFADCNDNLPDGYQGHSLSVSDLELKHTIKLIHEMDAEINEIENEIKTIMDDLHSPILTIPGISYRMGAVILAEIGDFSRFDSADKILACAGMSPSTYQSGQLNNCHSHMEKRGSRCLRYALYNAAKYVCHWDDTFGAYLAKKRSEGKHCNVAISHAARKLVRVIYQLEKSGQPYRKTA